MSLEKYLVPLEPSPGKLRKRWKRSLIELTGRMEPKYRHDLSSLLLQSLTEVRAFPHYYHVDGVPCTTHMNSRGLVSQLHHQYAINKKGISALQFDNKGVYLVSVTKSGCLTVHDFESLYSQTIDSLPCLDEDESKHVLHLSLHQELDTVQWNPANQDEVACTSVKSDEVMIFDIGYISSDPVEVLKTRRAVTLHGSDIHKGLTDIVFARIAESSHARLIASDTNGIVNIWDRRMSFLPCLELTTNSRSTLNSIQLHVDNQMVFGAGRSGIVYMWDLRGGRAGATFQSPKEVCHPPVSYWKLSKMLENIGSLKAQSHIVSREVHSIDFDPSCPYQLAFHLDDGWNGSNISADLLHLRKPSWLPTYSIYVVGSSADNGIHLLDFYPDPSSPCHVDYSEDMESHSSVNSQTKQNWFVPVSEGVTACAAHPLNSSIIAGTKCKDSLRNMDDI